jgi:catechol 2,3-dioxygenase-like lactoylglutathione lyase family enzyme
MFKVAATPCLAPGEPVQWRAGYCMLQMETDDEIAVSDCMEREGKRGFRNACASNMRFKRRMCALTVQNGTRAGTIEQCVKDPNFKGRTVQRMKDMTLKRLDNVLIVVDDLEATKAFFIELGLKLEGETVVEGPLVGSLIGLKDVRATLAMLRTPDGQGIELDKFHTPAAVRFGPVDAPVNTLGIRRIMFAVEDIGAVVARMRAHGAELIGEMQYGDAYRLAYIRGPEGIIVGLAEQLG